jgi:hypothetical protein
MSSGDPFFTVFTVWDCDRLLRKPCPKTWAALNQKTPAGDVRHCDSCDLDVYFCRTPADFATHSEQGHCVAIPDDLSPNGLGLGQPVPADELSDHAIAVRGLTWWEDVILRQKSFSAEQVEKVRAKQEELARSKLSDRKVAILRLAVESDGARCPHCGYDITEDTFAVMIYLETGQCFSCRAAFDLDLPSD